MSKKTIRQQQLLNIVKRKGFMSVKEFADLLFVSEMTVRRDLEELKIDEKKYYLFNAFQKEVKKKESIGKFASSLLKEDELIVIDIGSTTSQIIPHLPQNKKISVLCFSANTIEVLKAFPNITIYFCGGVYHSSTEMCTSPEGLVFLSKFRPNKYFMSAAGVDMEFGITCANNYEVELKCTAMKYSQEKILLADSSKFGKISHSYIGSLDDIDTIITNSDISNEWKEKANEKGIKLLFADDVAE